MQETALGVRVIKAFALEEKMATRMEGAISAVEKRSNAFTNIAAITSPMMDTLSGLAIAGIVALSTFEFLGLGNSTPGALISFVTALLMAYEPAKRLTRLQLQIHRSMIAVSRVFELMDRPDSLPNAPEVTDIPQGAGEVVFEGVEFAFKGRKKVLKRITQTFAAGKTTALVGPSGGGKSTVMNLIMRMYDPVAGRVLIDGVDLRQASTASLRSKIAFVSQDTFLFSSSIMDNIRLGRDGASDEDVIAAAKQANAHEFIMDMKHGYDTEVGENGSALSGGQKQRIAIARAVLRGAPILLLDEATSALDAISEGLVQNALAAVSKGRTTVVIAHRLSTILSADMICYVEGGKITERGTITQLLAMNGGFARLYNEQFSGTV
ncbi:MAG: ABC transporter ATP-binding protein [Cypionkella sp.]|nr:ABC transporter ATP-binding protein [Cypionkella sp.]